MATPSGRSLIGRVNGLTESVPGYEKLIMTGPIVGRAVQGVVGWGQFLWWRSLVVTAATPTGTDLTVSVPQPPYKPPHPPPLHSPTSGYNTRSTPHLGSSILIAT